MARNDDENKTRRTRRTKKYVDVSTLTQMKCPFVRRRRGERKREKMRNNIKESNGNETGFHVPFVLFK